MEKEFKKSKYYSYLVSNMEKFEEDRMKFNSEVSELLSGKTDELGTVLKCHLIIEYYIDLYLKSSFPAILHWQQARLTFNQKLELMNNQKTLIGFYYESIKNLNTIRNKFSHKLSYSINKEDYSAIKKAIEIWYNPLKKEIPEDPLKLLEDFTIWVCGSLKLTAIGIETHSNELGLSGYLAWLREMQTEDPNKQ
jgi:hypothetical protein